MASPSPRKTNVYVDGFNLYYGALKGTPYKWLDLEALAKTLMPNETIQTIRYFSARVSGVRDPAAPARQGKYLRALRTFPRITIHLGTFLSNDVAMHLAPPPATGPVPHLMYLRPDGKRYAWVTKTEEKGSDVNLATSLLLDAFNKDCELAVVISNDSDLMEPIRLVRQMFHPVGIVNPHQVPSAELRRAASWQIPLFASHIKACQLPDKLTDGRGEFEKPPDW